MRPGELLIVGFEGQTAPSDLLARIAAGRLGGVVLFTRNLGSPAQIVALTSELAAAAPSSGPPLLVCVDQEGGRVQRVKAPLTVWPSMAALGRCADLALSEAVGRALGAEIAALGFNVDFAPVLDVHTNAENPIIGDRAFAPQPEAAASQAIAFLRGLEANPGLRGCGKHFPGHGDTSTDSHLQLPRVDADLARLRRVELLPFARAIQAGLGMVMTAHVLYPALDALPATLSHRWLSDILRRELGFAGVVVSDDLDMKAVRDHFSIEQSVVEGLRAGVDAFLACRDPLVQQEAEEALERASQQPEIRRRLDESSIRLREFRQSLARRLPANAWQQLPLLEHAALVRRILA